MSASTPAADDSKEKKRLEGPGNSFVHPIGIMLVALYLITATILCITAIAQMWPHPTPTGIRPKRSEPSPEAEPLKASFLEARCAGDRSCERCEKEAHGLRSHFRLGDEYNDPECVGVFGWNVVMWNERRLMLIVVLSGMLGGFLYANRSFFWYVGNRTMVTSWIPVYFFAPLTSALLGLIIYLVIRGGFFSGVSTIGDTSPYAFAAVAVLVGMHHRETAEKLREIFEVVFTKAKAGKNDADNPKPRLTEVKSDQTPPLSRTATSHLTLIGEGFVDGSAVRFNGQPFTGKVVRVSGTHLDVEVRPDQIDHIDDSEIVVTVFNGEPGGGSSEVQRVQVESKKT